MQPITEKSAVTSVLALAPGKIEAYTGLSGRDFARAGFAPLLEEQGWLYDFAGSGFTPWRFTGTHEEAGRIVVSGALDDSPETVTLRDIFLKADASGSREAAAGVTAMVCGVIENGIEQGIPLPASGPGATVILGPPEHPRKLLFLPESLPARILKNRGESEYAEYTGWYRNPLYEGGQKTDPALLRFMESSYIYRALAGVPPYDAPTAAERFNDYRDGIYAPLSKLFGRELPEELAAAADANLSSRGKPETPPAALFAGAALGLPPASLADAGQKLRDALAEQRSRAGKKRFLRRWRTELFFAAGALICVLAVVLSFVRGAQDNYSTRGLTARQTVEVFYSGINTLQPEMMEAASKGKSARGFVNGISTMFATSKIRQAYEAQTTMDNPALWLARTAADPGQMETASIFGITRFAIDGKPADSGRDCPRKTDKVPPIDIDETGLISEGSRAAFQTDYYMLSSSAGTGLMTVSRFADTLELTFEKNRWLVTGVERVEIPVLAEDPQFLADYQAALDAGGSADLADALAPLRPVYPWLPQDAELARGAK
jgi:hypothetical protein